MTSRTFEQRLAAAIGAYADRAPTDVDPWAMTQVAVAGSGRDGSIRPRPPVLRTLALAFLLIALLVAVVTGGVLVAGGRSPWVQPDDALTRRAVVEPFVGLPPLWAEASSPDQGELLVGFGGRPSMLGHDFYRTWLYRDGRLLWKREVRIGSNLDAWGSTEPSTAIIEQRLSPEGVELLHVTARAGGLSDLGPADSASVGIKWKLPGVLWGGLRVRIDGRLRDVGWSEADLPRQLADPGPWLPAGAWADRTLGGYVPSAYAVCLDHVSRDEAGPSGPDEVLGLFSAAGIRIRTTMFSSADATDVRCQFAVATEDARAIATALDQAFQREQPDLRWSIPPQSLPTGASWVELLPILPNGEAVCNCG